MDVVVGRCTKSSSPAVPSYCSGVLSDAESANGFRNAESALEMLSQQMDLEMLSQQVDVLRYAESAIVCLICIGEGKPSWCETTPPRGGLEGCRVSSLWPTLRRSQNPHLQQL